MRQKHPDIDMILQEYGYFISAFEKICFNFRQNIEAIILTYTGASTAKRSVTTTQILLEGLTAERLCQKFYSTFLLKYNNDADGVRLVKTMKNIFLEKIVPVRNFLAHGVIGFGVREMDAINDEATLPERDFSKFSITRHKLTSTGFDKNERIIEYKVICEINQKMDAFEMGVYILFFMCREYPDIKADVIYKHSAKYLTLAEGIKLPAFQSPLR